jgi:3-phenylpropionate/trans-cinnamate dioxygenase ferredoxin component
MTDSVDLSKYEFIQVVEASELASGERLFIEFENEPLVVFNIAGSFYVISDLCTHDDGPVGEGELEGHTIICPRHGARFDVRTGKVLTLPAITDIPTYPVRVKDGWVEIGVEA